MAPKIRIPLLKPSLVSFSELEEDFREIWRSGQLTLGKFTQRLEDHFREACQVEHAVAVSSCTAGLMLILRAMDLAGRVILPSFTWTSTAHAVKWNGLNPVFCDCEPQTYTIDVQQMEGLISSTVTAIVATNVFGLPPDCEILEKIAKRHNVRLVFDSAQGFGSRYDGKPAGGFGDAEVFSLSPTKGITAVEGGMVTTNDEELARRVRLMRDYGKSADGSDVEMMGLSARMSELHAAVGLHNARRLREILDGRENTVNEYKRHLSGVRSISFQEIPEPRKTCWTYLVIFVDENNPVTRDVLYELLGVKGIQAKRYFHPPVHLQRVYGEHRKAYEGNLPVTEKAGWEGLALPMYGGMEPKDIAYVCKSIREMI